MALFVLGVFRWSSASGRMVDCSHSLALKWQHILIFCLLISHFLNSRLTGSDRRMADNETRFLAQMSRLVCHRKWHQLESFLLLAALARLTLQGTCLPSSLGLYAPNYQELLWWNQIPVATKPPVHPLSAAGILDNVDYGVNPSSSGKICWRAERQLCITSGWAWLEQTTPMGGGMGWTPDGCTDGVHYGWTGLQMT